LEKINDYGFVSQEQVRFINGTIPQPSDESDPLIFDWQRHNDLVLSWIMNCLLQQIYATGLYVYIAKKVWDNLQQKYNQGNGTRVFHLRQAISFFKQENIPISIYFTHLKRTLG
jgi:hypothetical protein